MPSQVNVQITGRIQNLVFYKMGGKYYARTIPARVKQTKATKKRATEFGKASRTGKAIRQQLFPVIPFPSDNKMQTRLVSALFQWLRSDSYDPKEPCDQVPSVSAFQFTEGSTIKERWRVPLKITVYEPGMLKLRIPAFVPVKSITAPSNTLFVKCNLAAAGCNVEKGIATGSFCTSLDFNYDHKEVAEQTISLHLPTPQGSLIVAALSLEYNFVKNGYLQKTMNTAFMPAEVVYAMYF